MINLVCMLDVLKVKKIINLVLLFLKLIFIKQTILVTKLNTLCFCILLMYINCLYVV